MTYCKAWKTGNTILFIADSAISSAFEIIDEEDNSKTSAFGEAHRKYGNHFVYEKVNKIITLENDIVITFSGDLSHAFEAIQLIEDCLRYELDVREALNSVRKSIPCNDFTLLIGFKEEKMKLIKFDDLGVIEGEMFEIGSASSIDDWTEVVNRTLGFNYPDQYLLPITISQLQIESLRRNMMNYGAGGTFTGLTLSPNGITWCPDICYFLFAPEMRYLGFVTIIHRNSSVISLSSYCNGYKFMLGYKVEVNDSMIRQYSKELSESKTDYIVFSNIYQNKFIFAYVEKKFHNDLFRLWRREKEKKTDYRMVLSVFLQDLLFTNKYGEDKDLIIHILQPNERDYVSLAEHIELFSGFGEMDDNDDFI